MSSLTLEESILTVRWKVDHDPPRWGSKPIVVTERDGNYVATVRTDSYAQSIVNLHNAALAGEIR